MPTTKQATPFSMRDFSCVSLTV